MELFDALSPFYRSPQGACGAGKPTVFRLTVPPEYGCRAPVLFVAADPEVPGAGPSMDAPLALVMTRAGEKQGRVVFEAVFTPPSPGLWFYYFDLYVDYRKIYRGPLGRGYVTTGTGEWFQLTATRGDAAFPAPAKGAVFYQIFPDRFYGGENPLPMAPGRVYRPDRAGTPFWAPAEEPAPAGGYAPGQGVINTDYFGGTLAGIGEKLPYLAGLGVTHIYLNPIFEAHENHRYNTADYEKIDPSLGTEADFADLCRRGRELGISFILDGVFSHTGADSVYFNKTGRYGAGGAYNDPASPYRPWYRFDGTPPQGYRCWWGFPSLPETDEENESFRSFICRVVKKWLSLGAAGFRLDVADELPDDFLALLRKTCKACAPGTLLLGEVWEDASTKISYGHRRPYLLGNSLDGVMNYPFRAAVLNFLRTGDGAGAADVFARIGEHYPPGAMALCLNSLSTHDTLRLATALADEDAADRPRSWQAGRRLSPAQKRAAAPLAALGFALQYTLPGTPMVYYADEVLAEGYADPFNRGYYPWADDDFGLRRTMADLAALRRAHPALCLGRLEILEAGPDILCFARVGENEAVAVAVNRGGAPVTVNARGVAVSCPAMGWVAQPLPFDIFAGETKPHSAAE